MATNPALNFTNGTTRQRRLTKMDERDSSLSDQGTALCSEQRELMPSLFGEITSTIHCPSRSALNALSSATKAKSRPQSLSDRLTPSLITAGLVAGVTPRSIRKQLGAIILAGVSSAPDGASAAKPMVDSSSLSGDEK